MPQIVGRFLVVGPTPALPSALTPVMIEAPASELDELATTLKEQPAARANHTDVDADADVAVIRLVQQQATSQALATVAS